MLSIDAKNVTIWNSKPRTDTTGNIMDVHDGNIRYWNGTYFWYGASYGNCQEPKGSNGCANFGEGNCGFRLDHNVSLWTSNDFVTWKPSPTNPIFSMTEQTQSGILFCPKVLYNQQNNNFVLWFNWLPGGSSFSESLYGVAVSDTPFGPFDVVNWNVTTLAFSNTGDFNLFLDNNGVDAYIIYTSHIQGNFALTHQMSVEKLTPDFQSTLGMEFNSGFFGQSFVEAPAMFQQGNNYFAVFGSCCCYCQSGSPVSVYVSSNSPLGPFNQTSSLGGAIPAQQTDISPVLLANGQTAFLWHGDEWQSAPDGIKGHDFSYLGLLQFTSETEIAPIPWQDFFVLDLDV